MTVFIISQNRYQRQFLVEFMTALGYEVVGQESSVEVAQERCRRILEQCTNLCIVCGDRAALDVVLGFKKEPIATIESPWSCLIRLFDRMPANDDSVIETGEE